MNESAERTLPSSTSFPVNNAADRRVQQHRVVVEAVVRGRKLHIVNARPAGIAAQKRLAPHREQSTQTDYLLEEQHNCHKDQATQCQLPSPIVHTPLCERSRLCLQSKWLINRLVQYNMKTDVFGPQAVAARALGISTRAVSSCTEVAFPDRHTNCTADDAANYSHAPKCHVVKKRMTRREMWARSINHIDGVLADKVKRIVHDQFYSACKTVSVSRLLQKVQEEMQTEGGFKCSESKFRLVLRGLGYRFTKINSRPVIFERQDLCDWRRNYLRKIAEYREKGHKIVYMDETWVFAGMTQLYDWVDMEAASNPMEAKRKGFTTGPKTPPTRGKRAIVTHMVAEDGLIDGAEMIFATNSTDSDGDYHREMNAEKFENYLKRCAPLLKDPSGIPVVLVIDNAPCHSRYADKKPTWAMRAGDMKAWLTSHNIPFAAKSTKRMLFDSLVVPLPKAKYNIYAAEQIAKEHGFIILRLPPYHCDMNPIELVWSWIKKALRDELRGDDKLNVVMSNTKSTLKKLPQQVIRNYFQHVRNTERRYASLDDSTESSERDLISADDIDDSDSEDDVEIDVLN
uniref:Tc1-like transposase DDE domain-containing protein n=2 Tax=Plectus sambesii TaxID=2011161 RepID=A0A914XSM9_9BILA